MKKVKEKNKFIKTTKNNWPILLIVIIAMVLNVLALRELGFEYTLISDDLSYVNSGITFLETGQITMHGVISAQIMPGMTFIIALFALIFGKGLGLWISLKIFWILMGIVTIIVIHKIMKLFTKNKYISVIPCLLFLTPDYVWMNNLILTETPYLLMFTLLIYHSIKLAKEQKTRDYIFIVLYPNFT